MAQQGFEGCGTALVTPLTRENVVDRAAFIRLLHRQIEGGVDFVVPCGTTGGILTHDEKKLLIRVAVAETKGTNVRVLAGTGTIMTDEVVEMTRFAKQAGADGVLVVTPYYLRTSQGGLFAHFRAIAQVGMPIVVYNIPSRTGLDVAPGTMVEICKLPEVVGIKHAAGFERARLDIAMCNTFITHLSGDDPLTLPMMAVGGGGAISVLSNVVPTKVSALIRAAKAGNSNLARQIDARLYDLARALFAENNPIPVMAALAMMGLIEPVWRLPLVAPTKLTLITLQAAMKGLSLATDHLIETTPPI